MSIDYQIELDEELDKFNVWCSNKQENIGYLNYWLRDDYLEIADLLLDEDHRQLGIGSELIKLTIELAKSKELKKVILSTAANDIPVHNFYRKNGFKFVIEKPSGAVFELVITNT
ncbi:N-acetyltransferase [Shewanella loihica]|uniref:GCN5-related N-acetyltransferase n=1 Tax=Shewanella loihica (strain ATCC BAA-1088 / PV-4) TaxID=323850 RepID=A3QGK1_SHELP|nr:GNAT family N-acetyltransferase [Shewanella loihica]ABO24599.1 GCN5-related N-acetyltransferase [Shewanella loihica PV-4]